jgi:uncharacterized membrane protein YccC
VNAVQPDRTIHRALNQVRAAATLAPARPAYAAGLRAAIATAAPLAADQLLRLGGGTWMSLAGFSGALADRGGPYRTRAAALSALACAGAITAAVGTWAAAHPLVAIPLTFLVAVTCALARAYGSAGVSVGGAALNIYVIALAFPPEGWEEILLRAGFVVTGALWAMLVALVLWPLQPYRPVRQAVAEAYRAIARYADEVASAARTGVAPTGPPHVRAALEAARTAAASARRARASESGRGERLLVLAEIADQLFGQLLGLSDVAEAGPPAARVPAAEQALADALAGVAGTARAMADGIEAESDSVEPGVAWRGDAVRRTVEASVAGQGAEESRAHYEHAAAVLDRAAQYAGVAAAITATLNRGGPLPVLERRSEVEDPQTGPPLLAPLRAALRRDSVVLHYAVRIGVVTALAVGLTAALHLKRGYWVTLTAAIILQPYIGSTTLRAAQRVLGTIVGGVLTAALAALFHDPLAILALAFVFSGLSVAVLPLSYAAFSVFLTPTFVLLAEASAGDWHLAGLRIVNTVLGGGLALLGSRLLWPTPESERLPAYLAACITALRSYLERAVRLYGDRGPAAGRTLAAARRDVGLAILNADESFQRLVAEHAGRPEALAPVMTLLTYFRRFTASIAALTLSRHSVDDTIEALRAFALAADGALADLATAFAEQRPPVPLPPLPEPPPDASSPLLRGRISRLARQLKTLHDSVDRWARVVSMSPPAPTP